MSLSYDAANDIWTLETEELTGTLQPQGQRHGLKTLVHRPTGIDVVHPDYDVLNLFLLFATNRCMGQARTLERTVEGGDGALTVHWPATDEHNAELTAVYRLVEPNMVDLSVTVCSNWPYPAYEVFLSNYFPPEFQPWVYLQPCPYVDPPDQPQWVAPQVSDVFAGTGLVWPRDFNCSPRSVDGRWTGIWALYQWNPQRFYELPLMMQVHPDGELAAVMMSRPEHCYAVVSGYNSGNMDDPFKSQNPLYFSLFGDDLAPGDERTARVRLAVIELDDEMKRPLELYKSFAA
jgi:hypothetical protein